MSNGTPFYILMLFCACMCCMTARTLVQRAVSAATITLAVTLMVLFNMGQP